MTGSSKDNENIHIMCNMLQQSGAEISTRCGGHIHIGADYLTSEQSFLNLTALWSNTEKVLYQICNKAGDNHRGIGCAEPISGRLEEIIENQSLQFSENQLVSSFKKMQEDDKKVSKSKYFGMNMLNVGKQNKNTIEFRISNGTIDPQTWIENINLFGGMVGVAEQLTQIQQKSPELLTEEEIKKLDAFNRLCTEKLPEQEQLSILLTLAVSEDKRKTYEERYQVNSVLMENSPINAQIDEQLAKKTINPYVIGKAVLTGPEAVTGPEMQAAELRLIRDRERARTTVAQEQDADRIA